MADFLPGLQLLYTPGKENVVPDALSRRPDYMHAIAVPQEMLLTSDFLLQFVAAQQADRTLDKLRNLAATRHADYNIR